MTQVSRGRSGPQTPASARLDLSRAARFSTAASGGAHRAAARDLYPQNAFEAVMDGRSEPATDALREREIGRGPMGRRRSVPRDLLAAAAATAGAEVARKLARRVVS